MGIHARVEDYIKPPLDEEDSPKLVLNVQGGDLVFSLAAVVKPWRHCNTSPGSSSAERSGVA